MEQEGKRREIEQQRKEQKVEHENHKCTLAELARQLGRT